MQPTASQRSSQGQRSLAQRYLVDPGIFRSEAVLLSGTWLAVALASSVPHGTTPVEIEGHRLLAIRDGDGHLRVFNNVCRHRGTTLCEEATPGRNRIVCPYHGWSYELDGSLARAPNMDGVEGFAAEDYSLVEVESAIWQGILFVRFEATGERRPLSEHLGPLTETVAPWRIEDLEVVGEQRYEVNTNWKLLFQNYSECYHCPTLHPPLNRLTPFRDSENLFDDGPILGGPMRLRDPEGSMTTTGRRCAVPLPGLGDEEADKVYYFTVFPNLFLSLHPDYVLIHCLRRLAVARTRVDCWWLAAADAEASAFEPAIEFWNRTNREDWWVCEQMQLGISSAAYQPGPYSDLESLVAAFDRNYLQWLGS